MAKLSSLKWIDPWFVAFAIQGAVMTGLLPIIMPLLMYQSGKATHVGLIMAAMTLGGISAPLWGKLGDRYQIHRWLLAGGMLAAAVGLALFASTEMVVERLLIAIAVSTAAAASATMANLFVVERYPKAEWDRRISSLQTFFGAGWVIGLLLGAFFSRGNLEYGFYFAAFLMAIAAVIAWATTKTIHVSSRPVSTVPPRVGDWFHGDPQRHYHYPNRESIRGIKNALRSNFGLFMASWWLSIAGAAMVFAIYPILMQQVFGIDPSQSAIVYAFAAAIGLFFYRPAGNWTKRFGTVPVYRVGLALRFVPFVILAGLVIAAAQDAAWAAQSAIVVIVVAWSLLSVCGSWLAAALYPGEKGAGMGIFNAGTAVAGVSGALVGGWMTDHVHDAAAVGGAAIGLGLSLGLAYLLVLDNNDSQEDPSDAG